MPKQSKLSAHDKTVQMAVGDLDSKRLQLHSVESGLVMMDVLNQLFYLANLRVRVAKDGAEIDPTLFGSQIELLTLLTLHDTGLLNTQEFTGALVIANKYPTTNVAERLAELREIVTERIELLQPHWETRRAEMASQKERWNSQYVSNAQPVAVAAE